MISLRTLRKDGLLVAIAGDLSKRMITAVEEQEKRATANLVAPDQAGLESLAALADQGKLEVHVEETFPFEQAAEAHVRLQGGRVRGKLALSARR
jgi:NADPH:quinone reductase-like Zn-dependent oxidoreductase